MLQGEKMNRRRDSWLATEFLWDGAPRWVRWRCAHGHTAMVDRLEVKQQHDAGTGWVPRCRAKDGAHVLRPINAADLRILDEDDA